MGKLAGRFRRFPLLLKFLDVREMLSVQVHPTDPETAKTEAWVVLEAGTKSRIYAGLKPGTTADDLRQALTNGTVADRLACFHPKPGDAVFTAGWDGSLSGRRRRGVRGSAEQRRDVSLVSTGTMSTRRQVSRDHSRWIRRWPASILAQCAGGLVAPVVETTTPSEPREAFSLRPLLVVSRARRIAVYGRRRGCAARAGMHRGQGATQSWRRDI